MKTILIALALILTSLELRAQVPPPGLPAAAARTNPLARFGHTNGPGAVPRFPMSNVAPGTPGAVPVSPQTVPGGGAVGRPVSPLGAPGVAGGTPVSPVPGLAGGMSGAPAARPAAAPEEIIDAGVINFQGVDLTQVLDIYAKYVGRTLLRATLPDAKIVLKTETPLTKTEVIQALQAVLALNGISVINLGEKFVKVVPSAEAGAAGAENTTNLPPMGSYVTHITQLRFVKPSIMAPFLQQFAKLPNAAYPIDDNAILILRDYAENVQRMLEMIKEVDVDVPKEYISEVIPIRYAMVDDIAQALNSLGGGGGVATGIGSRPSNSPISGIGGGRTGGFGGMGGTGMGGMGSSMSGIGAPGGIGGSPGAFGSRSLGGATANPNGTPTGGSSFASRLNSIINRASSPTGGAAAGQDQIQLFGTTKIIPNESSSTLLIYATRQDMAVITNIIAKLDVPLAQVLIEAVIVDVTLGRTFDFGVSAAQNPSSLSPGGNIIGGGGINNGQTFANFLRSVTGGGTNANGTLGSPSSAISSTLGTNGVFNNSLPGGLSYFGTIGQTWDVALKAAETDSHASIIQRPRIQTSQAKPAQFFVGNTVPYVTSSYGGYGGYAGNSYSQLSVGVELDVTPFINPEGLVSMDIQQEIDDLNGYTAITGVGNVPNTIKRTLNASITVSNRETVMLGGFIKSDKSTSKSGVPFLQDIPWIGNLFSSRSDSKDRKELIVLMRPTVLPTPEMAARHTVTEEQRLPGVSGAVGEDAAYERTLVDAQRKKELKKFKNTQQYDGFYVPAPEDTGTNLPPAASIAPRPAPAAAADTSPVLTPEQTSRLNALLSRYMAGEITKGEYLFARQKIVDESH